MINEFIRSLPVILPITLITMVLAVLPFAQMEKFYGASRWNTAFGYLIGGLIFGFIAIYAYHFVANRWPANPDSLYLQVGLISAAVLTLLAVVMGVIFKRPVAILVWTAMNFLWGAGYGIFLPRLLH